MTARIKRSYPRDYARPEDRLAPHREPQSRFVVGRGWRLVGLIVVAALFAIGWSA